MYAKALFFGLLFIICSTCAHALPLASSPVSPNLFNIAHPAFLRATGLKSWELPGDEATLPQLQRDCSQTQCSEPLCANPQLKPGECCSSCEDSNCIFEGCVNFNVNGRTKWAPDPCRICQCDEERNEALCAVIDCGPTPTEADCLGFPVVTKPNTCCPQCDFGVPDNTCQPVPQVSLGGGRSHEIQITASQGFQSCSTLITPQTCDKFAFRSGSKKFRCDPVEGQRTVAFDNCPINSANYTDVTSCEIIEDSTLIVGCDLVV